MDFELRDGFARKMPGCQTLAGGSSEMSSHSTSRSFKVQFTFCRSLHVGMAIGLTLFALWPGGPKITEKGPQMPSIGDV